MAAGFGASISRQNRKVGGTGTPGWPAARAASSSMYTGSVWPVALAKERSRPFSTSTSKAGRAWPMKRRSIMSLQPSHGLIERDDASATEAEVVLQREPRAFDLALVGLPAQLPDQLGALRQS